LPVDKAKNLLLIIDVFAQNKTVDR